MAGWRQIEAETGMEPYVEAGNLNVSDGAADAHLDTLATNAREGGATIRWLDTGDLRREFPQFRRGRWALLVRGLPHRRVPPPPALAGAARARRTTRQ